MVARDHERADAGAPGPRDGVPGLGTWRIDHADEPREYQVMLNLRVEVTCTATAGRQFAVREPSGGDPQRAKGLTRERLVDAQDLRATRRRQRPRRLTDELVRTPHEEHVRRALGEHDSALSLLRVAVDRAHQLALG
jgi:hypothetical protein